MAGSAASRAGAHSGAGTRLRAGGAAVCVLLVTALLVSPVLCWAGRAAPAVSEAGEPDPLAHRRAEVAAPAPAPAPVPPPPVDTGSLLAAVTAAAAGAGATVEGVVLDRAGRPLLETAAATRPVYSASLVKLLVVHQALTGRAGDPAALDPRTVARMERAITVSDDAAMNLLWDGLDGDALVRAAAAEFGLTGTAPPVELGQWGQATTTAADMARFLAALAATPEEPASAAVLGWMRAAGATAADGFDQRFGLLTGVAGPGVAAKQGWMCCVDGRRQLHSAGVLADGRVVVLLAEAPQWSSWGALSGAVDDAAAALVAGTA